MRRLATAIAAIELIGTPAFAADMAVKAPPPPPAPVYNWTGFYVGGNVGYSWGKADTDINVAPGAATFGGSGTFIVPGFAASDSVKPNGVIGGGQIGYNSQQGNFIFGIEADFQGSGEIA